MACHVNAVGAAAGAGLGVGVGAVAGAGVGAGVGVGADEREREEGMREVVWCAWRWVGTHSLAAVSIWGCTPVRYNYMHRSPPAWMSHHGSTPASGSAQQNCLPICVYIPTAHIYGICCKGCGHAQLVQALIHVYIVL